MDAVHLSLSFYSLTTSASQPSICHDSGPHSEIMYLTSCSLSSLSHWLQYISFYPTSATDSMDHPGVSHLHWSLMGLCLGACLSSQLIWYSLPHWPDLMDSTSALILPSLPPIHISFLISHPKCHRAGWKPFPVGQSFKSNSGRYVKLLSHGVCLKMYPTNTVILTTSFFSGNTLPGRCSLLPFLLLENNPKLN
jgi:hypothetical protein